MDKRILELALEALHKRMTAIDAEIKSIKTQLEGGTKPKSVAPAAGKRKARTAAQRKAQSEIMKKIWAAKRAKTVQAAKKATPPKPKKGPSAAARKAQSERMKAYWAKKRAAKSMRGKKPA
jgi:hypothetical protein